MKLKSFEYAIKGLITVFKTEKNFKYMVAGFMITLIFAFYFKITKMEWLIVLICSGVVLTLEVFNTVFENMVDFISPDFHIKAGQIKDMAAGAVLIASLFALVIGLIIFVPYIQNSISL